jgi:hypothetical protein
VEHPIVYTARERGALWLLAILGGVGLNGAFVYGMLARPGALEAALVNPIALAYLLPRWGVTTRSRLAFVVLSLLGGVAFALPVALLWKRR